MSPSERGIRPHILDLSRDDVELHDDATAALTQTLTPMIGLVNHGCEVLCRELADAMRKRIRADGGLDGVRQQACELDGECAAAADDLRACLRGVCLRTLRIVLKDPNIETSLAARSLDVEGRLCLRAYPAVADAGERSERLGAHCDSTLLTLLWSDGPGLEVIQPRAYAVEGHNALPLPFSVFVYVRACLW